ncbi:Hypothetical predicted protein [Cloeon dipterum]|uniref:Uncharacterized protein n=1 Tax=Cloeon dipterum TaxID=197152 RepID=A0A8S1CKC2_9INSE|nr:Hypothetical predicted protein [Cloeon dipterum]
MGDDCGGDHATSSSINEPSCSHYGSAESSLHQPSCSNQQPTTSDNREDGIKHHSSADDVRSVIAASAKGSIQRSPVPSRRNSSSSNSTITNDYVVVPEVVEEHKVEKPNIMKSTTPPTPQIVPMPTVHNVVTFEDEIKKDTEWARKQKLKKKKEKNSKCCCS